MSYSTVDEYIAVEPPEVQEILNKVRAIILACAPQATEKISFQMPAYVLNGPLVYFAACKKHLGIYPTGDGMATLRDRLSGYSTTKGAVQFPYNKPIPYELIREIVQFRVFQNTGEQANT